MIAKRLFARSASVFPRSSSWICPSCVSRAPIIHHQRRNIRMPALNQSIERQFRLHGVPNLLSSGGYDYAWTQYEQMLVDKLSELLAGDPMEAWPPKQIIMQTARDPMQASIFNYASMAHNNHFFFESLSTAPKELEDYQLLEMSLAKSFGSIETLKATMLDTAASMFGPGFVWLVWGSELKDMNQQKGAYRILTTYNAGTPYPEAGYRQQGLDMNTNNAQSYQEYRSQMPANTVGAMGPYSPDAQKQAVLPPGSTHICPVLCVSTWEHVYLRDFGPAGKSQYLSQWWDCIEWSVVNGRLPSPVATDPNRRLYNQ